MDISGASQFDIITLKAEIRSLFSDKYNCENEMTELKKRLDNYTGDNINYKNQLKENIALRKLQKSCGVVSKRLIDKIDNIEYYTCLCKFKHPYFNIINHMVDAFDKGIHPFKGGLLDQPAQSIELIQIVRSARIKERVEKEAQSHGK